MAETETRGLKKFLGRPKARISFHLQEVAVTVEQFLDEATEHMTISEHLHEIERLSSKAEIADYLGRDFVMEHFSLREDSRD